MPGSKQSTCADCHEPIWIAESSKFIVADDPNARFVCIACGMTLMILDEDPQIMPPTEQQKQEITDFFDGVEYD